MALVNVYLTFNGDCAQAFDFYKSVFGGEFSFSGKFKDMPPVEGQTMSVEDGEKIMHISLPVSKETTLMGSDTGGEWSAGFKQGTNFSISVTAQSREEADRLFNGLSEGGHVTMPMNQTFWGDYFGMCNDKFGISWMMSFNEAQQQQ